GQARLPLPSLPRGRARPRAAPAAGTHAVNDPNERRAFAAIALCIVVFVVWSRFFGPKPDETAPSAESPAASEAASSSSTGAPAASTTPTAVPSTAPAVVEAPCEERRLGIGSSTVRLEASTCGGALRALDLPRFQAAATVTPWW